MSACHYCAKPVSSAHNYCGFQCMIAEARAAGGAEIAPNGLRIGCIRHDSTMLEHEHGDHPDYKFPVAIESSAPDDHEYPQYPEEHALIYTDGSVAVTLYECCYAIWHVGGDGGWLGGSLQSKTERMDEVSLVKTRALASAQRARGAEAALAAVRDALRPLVGRLCEHERDAYDCASCVAAALGTPGDVR